MRCSAAAAEKPLAQMSDMPMRGLFGPVTTGGAAIDKSVDDLGVTGDVMEP